MTNKIYQPEERSFIMQLIVGLKGTGKTKNLIEAVNQASEKTNGVVICIECGRKLTFDIKPHARLVDVEEYERLKADAPGKFRKKKRREL